MGWREIKVDLSTLEKPVAMFPYQGRARFVVGGDTGS